MEQNTHQHTLWGLVVLEILPFDPPPPSPGSNFFLSFSVFFMSADRSDIGQRGAAEEELCWGRDVTCGWDTGEGKKKIKNCYFD